MLCTFWKCCLSRNLPLAGYEPELLFQRASDNLNRLPIISGKMHQHHFHAMFHLSRGFAANPAYL